MEDEMATNTIQDFLTPEAMLTPGVAGSMTMMITNALVTFCVAVGANGLGANSPAAQGHSFLLGISPAYAQASVASSPDVEHCANISATVDAAQKAGASSGQIVDLVKPCENLSQDILKNKAGPIPAVAPNIKSGAFFSPWKF